MKTALNNLSEIIAKANDLFFNKFDTVDTIMGIMDKTLRKQGMKADAITIDCIALNKKIVIVLYDEKPDIVEIALGNKAGDIHSSCQYNVSDLSVGAMLEIMEANFIVKNA
jgi:hypothetical protein